jgi:hypothetical protein
MKQSIFKPIKYDRHARRRMKWRKISKEEVELTLKKPDKTELIEKRRKNAFKSIGKRLIKITFREFPEEILVISAVEKSD